MAARFLPRKAPKPKAERPKRQRFSRRDFVAGLTNAVTNIPDAMANAVLAGVNPVRVRPATRGTASVRLRGPPAGRRTRGRSEGEGETTMPLMNLGDATIHYEERGSGPLTFVFCHGRGGSGDVSPPSRASQSMDHVVG